MSKPVRCSGLAWLVALVLALPLAAEAAGFVVVARHPHDSRAFTQGLLMADGELYESTGRYGRSSLRRVAMDSGEVLARRDLDEMLFGEGLARVGDRLIQLSWREERALVYRLADLEPLGTIPYRGEGWGLAWDGEHLVFSDGSATLRFLDPGSFAPVRTLAVTDGGKPVERLNELEVIDGTLWANILGSDRIALIDLASGEVRRWLDLRALRGKGFAWRRARDLNGIAHDPASGHVYVTGKLWPVLYELRVDGVADAPGQGGEVAR